MTPEYPTFYQKIRECYGTLLLQMQQIASSIDENLPLNEQADRVFALREGEKVAEDLLKEIRKLHNLQQKIACLTEINGQQDSADTDYCTGTSKEQKIFDVPRKREYDMERFDAVMWDLGVPVDTYTKELVRPHWPNLQEHYNERLARGEHIPIKTDDTFLYKYSVRKKRGGRSLDEPQE